MQSNGQLTSWPVFLLALQLRFAQSPYNDPTGALFKLTQRGSVSTYLSEFEELANRVVGLPQAFLLTCFVAGLSPEIRREVQILQPLTLAQAAGLACIQEEKFLEQRHASHPHPSSTTTPHTLPLSSTFPRTLTTAPQPLSTISTTLPSPFPLPIRPPPPSTKRLSPEEIASRREKGLCFTCDEKYHRGHRCASRVFLFVAEEDDPPLYLIEPLDLIPDPPDTHDPSPTQISLNSLEGHIAPETLHLVGTIDNHQVVLLIDGGSTHNFIQEQLVKQLGLPCQHTAPLKVMVGNGQHLDCYCLCTDVPIEIQSMIFTADLHVLPISGANVVLGVQWLKSLGSMLTDYNTLSMQFFYDGRLIELKGDNDAHLRLVSSPQFRRLCHRQGEGYCFHISMIMDTAISLDNSTLAPELQSLLTKYAVLFQPPHSLPPARTTNHHIHLLPQATPVNVRPYRYPHFQKHEIELQVDLMLQKGLIQPSISPF